MTILWVRCGACKGSGRRINSLMIEPIKYQICKPCNGTGWKEGIKVEREEN